MDDKIILFLRALYDIGAEEQARFLDQLSGVEENDKEKILIALYERYENINEATSNFDNGLRLLFNKTEESIDNLIDAY